MINRILFLLMTFALCSSTFSQQFVLKGKVTDRSNLSPLSFANIRIVGTSSGTTANFEGNFELRLKPGNYTLAASFIGYKSDTISLTLNSNKTINFSLEQTPVRFREITVLPGENPALEIIRRAIEAKHER
ncbi:MAG: carboxypeptidase-like regulatory domain-containing protein, partial [Bacteroidota bacterium]